MPLLYLPSGKIDDSTISYSLLWPIKDITIEEPIFRDYLVEVSEEQHRSARLSVWFDIPYDLFKKGYVEYCDNLKKKTK